jgi:hypothetical protein
MLILNKIKIYLIIVVLVAGASKNIKNLNNNKWNYNNNYKANLPVDNKTLTNIKIYLKKYIKSNKIIKQI